MAKRGPKKAHSGSFKKGQSGNPSGRPKEVGYLRDLIKQYGEEIVDKLLLIVRTSEKEQSVIAAAQILLERGYGKPTQALELTGADGGPIETRALTTPKFEPMTIEQWQRQFSPQLNSQN